MIHILMLVLSLGLLGCGGTQVDEVATRSNVEPQVSPTAPTPVPETPAMVEPVKPTGPPASLVAARSGLAVVTGDSSGQGQLSDDDGTLVLSVEVGDATYELARIGPDLPRGECGVDPFAKGRGRNPQPKKIQKYSFYERVDTFPWWTFQGDNTVVALRFDHDAILGWVWDDRAQCARAVNLTPQFFVGWSEMGPKAPSRKRSRPNALASAKRILSVERIDEREAPSYGEPPPNRRRTKDFLPLPGKERIVFQQEKWQVQDKDGKALYSFGADPKSSCMKIKATVFRSPEDVWIAFDATYSRDQCSDAKSLSYDHYVLLKWHEEELRVVQENIVADAGYTYEIETYIVATHRMSNGNTTLRLNQSVDTNSLDGGESDRVKCPKWMHKEARCEPGRGANIDLVRQSSVWTLETPSGLLELAKSTSNIQDERPGFLN